MQIEHVNQLDDVRLAIAHLKTLTDDYEAAHKYEDELHQRIFWLIARSRFRRKQMVELAELAMSTASVKFPRVYA